MKRIIPALAALALVAIGPLTPAHAQLWDGSPLPPLAGFPTSVDAYFVPPGPGPAGLSEFDLDVGIEFSLANGDSKPIGIKDPANGWVNAALFGPIVLEDGDSISITFLGKTAGAVNDFGINLGGSNAFDDGDGPSNPSTLWPDVTVASPGIGNQVTVTNLGLQAPVTLDFWLNVRDSTRGGTYSVFDPASSVPSNSGLPEFNFSAFGKVFTVNDSISETDRSILVLAIEDFRDFDADFTDLFFAIEISDHFGNPQFPVPEPSTYGLIGAMMLLGLAVVRRTRRS